MKKTYYADCDPLTKADEPISDARERAIQQRCDVVVWNGRRYHTLSLEEVVDDDEVEHMRNLIAYGPSCVWDRGFIRGVESCIEIMATGKPPDRIRLPENHPTPRSKLFVRRQQHDWQACIDPSVWGCGGSPEQAIGDLVITHPNRFGVCLVFKPPSGKVQP